jgi:hypothetical protein
MELLYRGFDGLEVSFMARIGSDLCGELDAAKVNAQDTHHATPIVWNGVRMLIAESGARGGYAFIASTGEFGATWFFKRPIAHDPWGVRVSCNSFNLAVNGLGAARSELYEMMESLGISAGWGNESIGRVDYALDFLASDFVLVPDHFVMHSNANRADHFEHPEVLCNGRSGRVSSVTIGKMPGQQVIVYDKRAEVIAKHKVGWWEIWNSKRAEGGLPPLNPENATESRVWRVELRAGKRHLKDRWDIRRWADLDARFGDLIAAMLSSIRYTQPRVDSNRSRWVDHRLWRLVRQETEGDLMELRNWTDPDLVKRVQLDEHDQLLARQMLGLLTTRAALHGVQLTGLPAFVSSTAHEMIKAISKAPARTEQKLASAAGRYRLGRER